MKICQIDPTQMPREQRMNCIIVMQKFQTFVSQAIRNLQGHKQEFQELQRMRNEMNKNYCKLVTQLEYLQIIISIFLSHAKPAPAAKTTLTPQAAWPFPTGGKP